jgi:hypothetical protein
VLEVDRQTDELLARLKSSPRHGPFIEAVERSDASGSDVVADQLDLGLALVPGILYREHPETGADGQVLREVAKRHGWPLEVIESEETGSLARNTRHLLDWLEQRRSSSRIILVSLSKGSAEVWRALHSPRGEGAFASVAAWVSVSGIPLGTPSLDHLTRSTLRRILVTTVFRWKGWDPDFLTDYGRGTDPAPDAALPEAVAHLRVFHLSGFPHSGDLRDRRSRRLHRRLAARGPNDGFALLGELCQLPGQVYPVARADHYLHQVDDLPDLMGRVLAVIRGAATRSAG